jgi:hypothetical protein
MDNQPRRLGTWVVSLQVRHSHPKRLPESQAHLSRQRYVCGSLNGRLMMRRAMAAMLLTACVFSPFSQVSAQPSHRKGAILVACLFLIDDAPRKPLRCT